MQKLMDSSLPRSHSTRRGRQPRTSQREASSISASSRPAAREQESAELSIRQLPESWKIPEHLQSERRLAVVAAATAPFQLFPGLVQSAEKSFVPKHGVFFERA